MVCLVLFGVDLIVCFEFKALGETVPRFEFEATTPRTMTKSPPSLDHVELGAYFALIEVSSLLRHAIEQQLRDAGDVTYVQFQLLARLAYAPEGSHRMTDLADGVVYSRSGLTFQVGLL